jgi:putative intracellular protease/amidase
MKSKTAFLWDESFIWGLMAYEALKKNNLPFELIRSEDIKQKGLNSYSMLFVPGGWASNKLKALGDEGIAEIKRFVKNGGNYLGLCGGAGLATMDGIGLLGIKRKPTKDRVPSFSGRISLSINKHQIWEGLDNADNKKFHAWWPSQFVVQDNRIKILAAYGEPMPDAFSSDLCIGDVLNSGRDWSELESIYKINLNPSKLIGEPAVVEGIYGKGKIILSLIHFDTPEDIAGHAVLKNMWKYLSGEVLDTDNLINKNTPPTTTAGDFTNTPLSSKNEAGGHLGGLTESVSIISELFDAAKDLISFGERNFLWFQRNPMFFQWRRGVRGLEYCNLYMLIKKINDLLHSHNKYKYIYHFTENLHSKLFKIRGAFLPFYTKAKKLLLMERLAMQNGHITYEKCDEQLIQSLRLELFSASKSYGGMYKRLIDDIDRLLFDLIQSIERSDLML